MYHVVLNVRLDFTVLKDLINVLHAPRECTKMNQEKVHASHAQKEPLLVKMEVSQVVNAFQFADTELTVPQGLFHVWSARETLTVVIPQWMVSRNAQVVQLTTSHSNLAHKT